MPRKLNWNRSLNVNDTGVKEVVRDLVGRSANNKEADSQLIALQEVEAINTPIYQSNDKLANQAASQSTNQSANNFANSLTNSVKIHTNNTSTNRPHNITKVQLNNQPQDALKDSMVDSSAFSPTDSTGIVAIDQLKMPSIDSANIANVDTPINQLPLTSNNNALNTTTKKKVISANKTTSISSVVSMAEWHTESEQKVYEAMYQETIAHRRKERFFTAQGLCEQTGIASQTTIRTAIQGLIEKRSIEVIERKGGGRLAVRYRVYGPVEIVARRRKEKIKIDEQSKKII